MNQNKNLWQWSACDIARAVKNREITCQDAVQSSIARMNKINPELNAVVIDLSKQAVEQAKKADQMVQSGDNLGSLRWSPKSEQCAKL